MLWVLYGLLSRNIGVSQVNVGQVENGFAFHSMKIVFYIGNIQSIARLIRVLFYYCAFIRRQFCSSQINV